MPAVPNRGVPFPVPMPGYSSTNETQFRRSLETRLRDLQAQVDAGGGGGGDPPGSDSEVIFNNAGAFGTDPTFKFIASDSRLDLVNLLVAPGTPGDSDSSGRFSLGTANLVGSYDNTTNNFAVQTFFDGTLSFEARYNDVSGLHSALIGGNLVLHAGNIAPRNIGATFDASPAEVESAVAQRVAVPFAGTITGWRIYSGEGGTGSAVFDVLLNGVSIVASAPPTITGDDDASSTTLTGWTTAFAAGDMFAFVVVSSLGFDNVTITLQATETITP